MKPMLSGRKIKSALLLVLSIVTGVLLVAFLTPKSSSAQSDLCVAEYLVNPASPAANTPMEVRVHYKNSPKNHWSCVSLFLDDKRVGPTAACQAFPGWSGECIASAVNSGNPGVHTLKFVAGDQPSYPGTSCSPYPYFECNTGTYTVAGRPDICASSTISASTISSGSPVTVTLTATKPIQTFSLAFYNLDNLYSPNNPKGIYFEAGKPFIMVKNAATPTQTMSFTINYADINKPDFNNGNQTPTKIQVNGYFLDPATGQTSLPKPECVKQFTITAPIPNCSLKSSTIPVELTVGQEATFWADFSSPQGDLRGQVFRDNFTSLGCTGCDTSLSYTTKLFGTSNTGSHSWTWTPTAADAGTHTISCRAWNDARAECRPQSLVDGPPRYACLGPNSQMNVNVSAPIACPWDIDGDRIMGETDRVWLNACYSPLTGIRTDVGRDCTKADLSNDGVVNALDYSILLTHWGSCP